MQRLLLVYNPRSSRYVDVEERVLVPARQLKGWMVGKYVIKPTSFDDNVQSLAAALVNGDLVVVAGGDGTAAVAVNAVILSGKEVTFAALGFGNFNDIAGTFGMRSLDEIITNYRNQDVKTVYLLEIIVDGKLWRYAVSYFTVGMFARSTEVFDNVKVRKKLQAGKKGVGFSIWQLAKWYFGKGKRNRLPAGKRNGEEWSKKTTDYIALNGKKMAHVMRGGEWYTDEHNYLGSTQSLGSFLRLMKFMLVSMREQVSGEIREEDILTFDEPSEVELHAEGEYEVRENVREIVIRKAKKKLKVVAK